MTEQSPTVGALLRSAREERGMAVAEVAERTRIRSTLIREIEVDDFGGCGGRVYARGHVRAIAAVVGLDPAPVLAEFDRAYADPSALSTMTAPQPLPTLPTPSTKARAREMARAQRSGPNWVSAMIAVAVLITLLVVASSVLALVQGRHRPQPQAGAAPRPTPAPSLSHRPSTAPRPTPKRTPGPPVAVVPQSGVNLRIRVVGGASWLRVADATGRELFQGVLRAGAVKDFRDQRLLSVRYGNSPAVTVVLNGKDLGSPKCQSNVCTKRYEPVAAG